MKTIIAEKKASDLVVGDHVALRNGAGGIRSTHTVTGVRTWRSSVWIEATGNVSLALYRDESIGIAGDVRI